MKKHFRLCLIALLTLLLGLCLSACNFLFSLNPIYSITFSKTELEISVGEKYDVDVTVSPLKYGGKVEYASSDEAVVTASATDDGVKITAVAVGAAKVTATATNSDATAEIAVTVAYKEINTLVVTYEEAKLTQLYVEGGSPEAINFSIANAGVDPLEMAKVNWRVENTANSNDVTPSAHSGRDFSFTPISVGVAYSIKASYQKDTSSTIIESGELLCGWYAPIQTVSISSVASVLTMGEEVEFTASTTPSQANQQPKLDWYAKINDGEATLIASQKPSIKYTPEVYAGYEIYAVANETGSSEIVSDSVYFTAQYAEVGDVRIDANKTVIVKTAEATLTAKWNKQYNNPALTFAYQWYINDVLQSASGETLSFSSAVAGEFRIGLKVNGVAAEAITITVKDRFNTLTSIKVTSDKAAVMASPYTKITYTATPYPSGVDPSLTYKWYLNGALVSGESDATFEYTPSIVKFAEYTVQAVVGYVESNKFVTATKGLSTTVSDSYLEAYHNYGGYTQNRYITSQEEMNNIIGYAREKRLTQLGLYIDYESSVALSAANGESKLSRTFTYFAESGVSPSMGGSGNSVGVCNITFNYDGASVAAPTVSTASAGYMQYMYSPPHFAETPRSATTELYLDTVEDTMNVASSNLLYKAAQWGFKPVFDTTTNSLTAKSIYNSAKTVLRSICNDEMSDLQKVHAIYDWICYNVDYDHNLAKLPDISADSYTNINNSMRYDGYYLEGVFYKSAGVRPKAVCDGKSKAFSLMCGIEGIKTVRVTGEAGSGVKGAHAWNKVLLDADDNGAMEWYVIDTTWGDASMNGDTEILSHGYFLLSDAEISVTHAENSDRGGPIPQAVNNYNYFKDTTFKYNSNTYDLVIVSSSEKLAVKAYAESLGLAGIEVYCTNSDYMSGALSIGDNLYIITV